MILHQCPVVQIVTEIIHMYFVSMLIWNKEDKSDTRRHNLEEPA